MLVLTRIIVGLEVYCILLSGILVYGLFLQQRQQTTKLFMMALLLNIVGLLSDIAYWVFDMVPGEGIHMLLRIADYLNHITVLSILGGMTEFFWFYLKGKGVTRPGDHRYVTIVWLLCTASAVFSAIAQSQNLFSYFDEYNRYFTTNLFWLSMVLPAMALVLLACFTLRYYPHLNRRERFSFLLAYIIVPAFSLIQQLINADLTFAYIYVNVMLLILYATIYSEQAKALRNKEMQIAQNKVSTMLTQIRPDFLYESLAVLEDMCVADPAHAKASVLDFTRHLRARLDAIALRELIPFDEELSHVQNYLAIEQRRLGSGISIVYDIGTTDFVLPALTVQSSVESLIDAGRAQRHITIASYETDADYCIEITLDHAAGPVDPQRLMTIQTELQSLCGGRAAVEGTHAGARCILISIPQGAVSDNAREVLPP